MTWVELLIVAGAIGVIVGVAMRRHPWARVLAVISLAVMVLLLVVFGREVLGDLT